MDVPLRSAIFSAPRKLLHYPLITYLLVPTALSHSSQIDRPFHTPATLYLPRDPLGNRSPLPPRRTDPQEFRRRVSKRVLITETANLGNRRIARRLIAGNKTIYDNRLELRIADRIRDIESRRTVRLR